ncbi:MAG: histidine kinase dimerization/phosphoacceptor domain -containing protein [Balneolaceae bacterium]
MLIAMLGIVSHRYSNSIQNQLLNSNIETTELVQITANIERDLYQSLVYLITIKDLDKKPDNEITIDEPTLGMLTQSFKKQILDLSVSLNQVKQFLIESPLNENELGYQEIKRLDESLIFYTSLSMDWLELIDEDVEEADALFNTSISPYFRNRVIPDISNLRMIAIEKQTQENNLLTDQLNQANYAIAFVSIICVLLSILIALYVHRSIAKPLKKLNEGAKSIGEGNLEEHIQINSDDELGELASSFNTMASNLQKRTLARDYLDNIIETIRETLIVTDTEGIIVGINKAGLEMLHYKKEEIVGMEVKKFYDLENMGDEYDANSANGSVFEFCLLTKRKKRIPVLFSEAELINGNNERVGRVCVATDITDRKKSDEQVKKSLKEKEVLLSEIHHRVKNNLAVISGILQLQAYETDNDEVTKALSESQARIQSISLVHEMLYHSDTLSFIDYRTYVNDLIQAITSMHINEGKNITVNSKVDEISLDVNQAIPCSLLLNEILVNSFKHAFKGKDEGLIMVEMRENNGLIELNIEDNGVGIQADNSTNSNRSSLGKTLINTLVSQLKGKYKFRQNSEGTGTQINIRFQKV